MPQTIVFDTNYLRSFGDSDYRIEKLPQKLHDQIKLAFSREDLVALPNTVRLETNAWLALQAETAQKSLLDAHKLLRNAGYEVSPEITEKKHNIDIATVLRKYFSTVYLLEPTIEDYREAERRTSYRLSPLPKKNPTGEEYRDRLIWCQLVSYARASKTPILLVSGDGLFHNGAASDEGKTASIEVVESESDLDQRLNQRPHHIQAVVDQLLMFSMNLQRQGVDLKPESIVGIEELRKVNEANGSLVLKFMLRTIGIKEVSSPVSARMVSLGGVPILLSLSLGERAIECARQIGPQEKEKLALDRFRDTTNIEQVADELRSLLRS
ncbi:MAG: DUF4935 domain-containing protein [Gammaproteobacteria bacterium]|nr:DUF4935 domain-containing protein [Gammaproteobacteria bacterium]